MAGIFDRRFDYSVKIPYNKVDAVETICCNQIGPRLYYLHVDRGGKGWRIIIDGKEATLEVNDEQYLTLIALMS